MLIAMKAMTITASTTTPTMIPVHGTSVVVVLLVVVVDVDESPVVDLGAVADEPFVEPLPIAPPPDVAGPVVVVVLEPVWLAPPEVCAKVIAGATARNSASRMMPRRKAARICLSP